MCRILLKELTTLDYGTSPATRSTVWVPRPQVVAQKGPTVKSIVLEVDDEGCGLLEFELPSDATEDEIAYIERLVPRLAAGLLELCDPDNGEVLFSCRPKLVQGPSSRSVPVLH